MMFVDTLEPAFIVNVVRGATTTVYMCEQIQLILCVFPVEVHRDQWSYFVSGGPGSLLKLRGSPLDQSLFIDTQLGVGDSGLWYRLLES